MAAIFISHSSLDNAQAIEMKEWLGTLGYSPIFLDTDRDVVLRGGVKWERELYDQIRKSVGLVLLLLRWSHIVGQSGSEVKVYSVA